MKKIGIVTIIDGDNYGNRLQNYALQRYLENLGYRAETIKKVTSRNKLNFIRIVKRIIKLVLIPEKIKPYSQRSNAFKKFNKKYIKESPYTIGFNKSDIKLDSAYDYFISGSDQVWNPLIEIVREDLSNNLLAFASSEKRISYAASFGITSIPNQYRNIFSKELMKFKAISVRENEGVQIVKDISRRNAYLVPDPTLLLSSDEWQLIEEKPTKLNIKKYDYLVVYLLGDLYSSLKNEIIEYANINHLKIIHLQNEFASRKDIQKNEEFAVNPSEFLWLIRNSKSVITDSFHGTVFSILFNRPFQTLHRIEVEPGNDMSSRILTLLSTYHLENRYRTSIDFSDLSCELNENEITEITRENKKTALKFIRDNLQ